MKRRSVAAARVSEARVATFSVGNLRAATPRAHKTNQTPTRERLHPEIIRAEGLPPEQRERELEEGCIARLATTELAVVMFATTVAAYGNNELLQRLTGFMWPERQSSEVLILFHECRVRTKREWMAPQLVAQSTPAARIRDGDSSGFVGRSVAPTARRKTGSYRAGREAQMATFPLRLWRCDRA